MLAHTCPILGSESKVEFRASIAQNDAVREPSQVTVSASDVVPLLVDAALTNRAWLEDFADEPLIIRQDLYEVLLAYRRFRCETA